jgi:hypothetical protein
MAMGPNERTNAAALPTAALIPLAGFWLMMLPGASVAWFAVVTVPTVSVAIVIAVVAAAPSAPRRWDT